MRQLRSRNIPGLVHTFLLFHNPPLSEARTEQINEAVLAVPLSFIPNGIAPFFLYHLIQVFFDERSPIEEAIWTVIPPASATVVEDEVRFNAVL